MIISSVFVCVCADTNHREQTVLYMVECRLYTVDCTVHGRLSVCTVRTGPTCVKSCCSTVDVLKWNHLWSLMRYIFIMDITMTLSHDSLGGEGGGVVADICCVVNLPLQTLDLN